MSVLALSPRLLLLIYAIAPLLVLVAALDLVVGGTLRAWLPVDPHTLFIYALLFNEPHVVASLFSLADKQYLLHYRWKLLLGLPLLLLSFGLLLWYSVPLTLIVFILITEYHVMSQHQGILRMLARTGGAFVEAWKWTGLLAIAIGYGVAEWDPVYTVFIDSLYGHQLVPYVLTAFGLSSLILLAKIRSWNGRLFLLFSVVVVVSVYVFLAAGYPFFAIFVSRFVHDAAAFAFYMTHDENRHRAGATNMLYRLFSFTKLPAFFLAPVLAVVLAYGLTHMPYSSVTVLLFFSIAHYYIESFVWKRDSIHRAHIRLAT